MANKKDRRIDMTIAQFNKLKKDSGADQSALGTRVYNLEKDLVLMPVTNGRGCVEGFKWQTPTDVQRNNINKDRKRHGAKTFL